MLTEETQADRECAPSPTHLWDPLPWLQPAVETSSQE